MIKCTQNTADGTWMTYNIIIRTQTDGTHIPTTLMYDEVAKTSTPEMKQEIMELSKIIQDEAIKVK